MHIHILGICGTFMGGVALLARAAGHTVTGCDANVYPPMSTQLEEQGIALTSGYDPAQVALAPDVFVVGNAISRGNPLLEEILERGLPYVSGPQWLADEVVATQAQASYVSHLPLGVVLSILPWNFPVWQIFRCAASALLSGNVIIVKHAPNVQGCAEAVAQLLHAAGFPPGVYQNLHAPVSEVGRIIADPRVAAVTLTGSAAAGAKVAAQAGAACKKSVLELGGSDAFIVLADADLDAAVAAGVRARFSNCGQVCLAAKRFIVEAPVAAAFAAKFAAAAAGLRVGDPLDAATQMGPMARTDLRDTLQAQIATSVQRGARVLTGGSRLDGRGWAASTYLRPAEAA